MENWTRHLGGFFNALFDILWNSINLIYISRLGEEDLVYDYLFTFQRESHSFSDVGFFPILLLILFHMELSRIELSKLTSSILMKIVSVPIAPVGQFYFYMHQPIKASLFQKIIFELDYHWTSFSLCFRIFLKSLVSY